MGRKVAGLVVMLAAGVLVSLAITTERASAWTIHDAVANGFSVSQDSTGMPAGCYEVHIGSHATPYTDLGNSCDSGFQGRLDAFMAAYCPCAQQATTAAAPATTTTTTTTTNASTTTTAATTTAAAPAATTTAPAATTAAATTTAPTTTAAAPAPAPVSTATATTAPKTLAITLVPSSARTLAGRLQAQLGFPVKIVPSTQCSFRGHRLACAKLGKRLRASQRLVLVARREHGQLVAKSVAVR